MFVSPDEMKPVYAPLLSGDNNSSIMQFYRAICCRNGPPSMIIGLTHPLVAKACRWY